jgi:uncharacterized protein (DUF433 family)
LVQNRREVPVAKADLYGGRDPRDVPTYGVVEAARYMRLPPTTLRQWVTGSSRVIRLTPGRPPLLSFWNLIEAYVLGGLRRRHRVPLQRVRKALRYVERELDTPRPLIEQQFMTDGLDLFVEEYGRLINASRAGQTAMRSLLEATLERVERDPRGVAQRLFPWAREPSEPREVELDPRRAFGKLVVAGTGIPTAIIADRLRAGDTLAHLADDYGLALEQVGAALRWELHAPAD